MGGGAWWAVVYGVAQSWTQLKQLSSSSIPMERSSKQKINKETQVLNDTLDELDLIDIFRTFHSNAEEYIFSSAHGTFSRIDHILSYKSVNLRKLKYQASCPTTMR